MGGGVGVGWGVWVCVQSISNEGNTISFPTVEATFQKRAQTEEKPWIQFHTILNKANEWLKHQDRKIFHLNSLLGLKGSFRVPE